MELESIYQLLSVLRDDGIRTYDAVEIASGQALQLHLFVKPDSETDRALYKALRALPVSKRRELLDMGIEGDKPYIVTEQLPGSMTAREWLTKLAGVQPPKPAGPVMIAGSWKTGTPIPDELIKASHSSLPPKPPPPKPEEFAPDYTRVMRLPRPWVRPLHLRRLYPCLHRRRPQHRPNTWTFLRRPSLSPRACPIRSRQAR